MRTLTWTKRKRSCWLRAWCAAPSLVHGRARRSATVSYVHCVKAGSVDEGAATCTCCPAVDTMSGKRATKRRPSTTAAGRARRPSKALPAPKHDATGSGAGLGEGSEAKSGGQESVKVAVRLRPFNSFEKRHGIQNVISIRDNQTTILDPLVGSGGDRTWHVPRLAVCDSLPLSCSFSRAKRTVTLGRDSSATSSLTTPTRRSTGKIRSMRHRWACCPAVQLRAGLR